MVRNFFFICFGALLLLVFCNAKKLENPIEKQQEETTSNNTNTAKPDDDNQTKGKSGITHVLDDFSMLKYFAFGCFLLSIVSIIIVLREKKRLKSSGFIDLILEQIYDSYSSSSRNRLRQILDDNYYRNNRQQPSFVKKEDLEAIIKKCLNSESLIDELVYKLLQSNEFNNKLKSIIESVPKVDISTLTISNTSKLYASSADSSRNVFFTITSQPDENTIYVLSVDGGNSRFYIYEGAFNKVLKAPDFLECASDVQIMGNRTVITKDHGKAEKQVDGTWKIISKAKIKFE